MPNSHLGIFKEWRSADQKAHAVEQALSRASLDALGGHSPAPSDSAIAECRRLRSIADDLFILAMAEMRNRAEQNRR